jgi:hypothetical protein
MAERTAQKSKTTKKQEETVAQEQKTTEQKKKDDKESILTLQCEPHEFVTFGKVTRIKLSELAASFTLQFKQSFNDYLGTNITYNGRNFDVQLIFEKGASGGEGKIDNLIDYKDSSKVNKHNLYSSMTYLNRKTSGTTYDLNEETKEILSNFMYGGPKAKKNWDQLTAERRRPAPYGFYQNGAESVCMIVTGIDINRLLTWYYGDSMVISTIEGDDGVYNKKAAARYSIRVSKYQPNGEIIVNIEQYDYVAVQAITIKENPYIPNSNGLVYF